MELFQLRYFVQAARLGNFSRAAEAAHISQPSLSVQMANLEREVGCALFARQGRTVQLTDAGKTLWAYAEKMLALEDDARRAVREIVGLARGRLTVWTLPTPGQNLLPPLLADFRRDHPGVEISVREAVPARAVAEAVANGQADLGIVHLPCPVAGLAVRRLLTEELALVVPEGHNLAKRASRDPPKLADLANEDFVWVPEGANAEHPFYAACLAAGFAPRIACVSGSAQGMQALVAAGLGIALLPRLAIHPPLGACVVEFADPRPTRTLAVLWRGDANDVSNDISDETNARLSHAARAFLNRLKETFGSVDN